MREVLQNIWWADTLRGDDEIYLQVKLVDTVTDKASDVSAKYSFVADTYAPQATQVEYVAPTEAGNTHGSVTALVSGDLVNMKHTHADKGDEVKVFYNGEKIGEGVVGDLALGYGQYLQIEIALEKALSEGYSPELLKVYVTDKAGNTGASDNGTVLPQVELPTPEVRAYVDDVEGITGDISHSGLTNDNEGSIRGTINLNDEGGELVDAIWVTVRGLGPIRIERSDADDTDIQNGIWTWTVT